MLSNNLVYLLNHYFNNNDFAHFVKIMTNIDINYNINEISGMLLK